MQGFVILTSPYASDSSRMIATILPLLGSHIIHCNTRIASFLLRTLLIHQLLLIIIVPSLVSLIVSLYVQLLRQKVFTTNSKRIDVSHRDVLELSFITQVTVT